MGDVKDGSSECHGVGKDGSSECYGVGKDGEEIYEVSGVMSFFSDESKLVKMFTLGVRIMKVRDLICKGSILYNVEGTPN